MVLERLLHFSPPVWFAVPAALCCGALYHRTGQKSNIKVQNCGIASGDVSLDRRVAFSPPRRMFHIWRGGGPATESGGELLEAGLRPGGRPRVEPRG